MDGRLRDERSATDGEVLRAKPGPRLTAKEREDRFVIAMADIGVKGNQTRAALVAGYPAKSASNSASLLMRRSDIRARILELREQKSLELNITADRILREYQACAFSNILDYTADDGQGGRLIDLDLLTRAEGAAISELQVDTYEENDPDAPEYVEDEETGKKVPNKKKTRTVTRTKVKFQPKLPALEALAKYAKVPGIGTTKVEFTNPDGSLAGSPVLQVVFVDAIDGRPADQAALPEPARPTTIDAVDERDYDDEDDDE